MSVLVRAHAIEDYDVLLAPLEGIDCVDLDDLSGPLVLQVFY